MVQFLLRHRSFIIFPVLILAYVLGEIYMLTYEKGYFYPYNMLPLACFILYFAMFHLQKLVFLLAFCTPLAISLKELGLTDGPDLSLPSEPLMAGIMLMYLLNALNTRISDPKFLRHPVSMIIWVQLSWMFVTTCTSSDFVVSIKYLISRLWFIFSCYIIIPHLFQDRRNIINFMFAYCSAFTIVIFYTIVRHAAYNFNFKASDWIVSPFYNDHTAYGAALAMFIPVLLSFVFLKSLPRYQRIIALSLFFLFILSLILSYARAGWLSLAVVLGMYVTFLLKIRFRALLTSLIVFGGLFLIFRTDILMFMSRNNTDSDGGFENNVESVSNISTDASNLERLNRWSCAIRMWEDKPFLGWGPGTYMFKYAPYQLSYELTIISTNFGTNGNAHSEYLGPLSEQGIFGMLIVIVLLLYVTSFGYRLVYTIADKEDRILCIGIFLGIMTYFVHGFFNNFLDTDKLSLPFWAFLAALVTFDLYYVKGRNVSEKDLPEQA